MDADDAAVSYRPKGHTNVQGNENNDDSTNMALMERIFPGFRDWTRLVLPGT